jgi:threonine dehydratase
MQPLEPVRLDEIRAAQNRIAEFAVRTPLVRLNLADAPARIFLKLENLQPIGSFKIRGAGNAMALIDPDSIAGGVYTASAGNWAQGVAWNAKRLGVPNRVIVPDHAPQTKLDAIERMGGEVVKLPFDEWWQVIVRHEYPGMEGHFIHPVSDPDVIAGNGTIGLEIMEDLPDVDAVIVPFGGGGLSSGIASAIRALAPETKIFASEVETAAPFAASLAAGSPQQVERKPSFVDGIGGRSVLEEMWPLTSKILDGSLVSSVAQVADAVRLLLERNRVLAEGAGATSVAAALSGKAGSGTIVCVVSGGNLDSVELIKILEGRIR